MSEKITYTNKESLINDTTIPDKNKVLDTDLNEIKQVVNNNADELDTAKEDIEANKTDITDIKEDIQGLNASKVDKVTGKGLSTNDYDNTEKANNTANTNARHTHSNKTTLDNTTASYTTEKDTKLNGIETGANKTVVDDELDNESTNPVQNKVIADKIQELEAENANLQQENANLRKSGYKISGTGETVTLNKTGEVDFVKLDIKGNKKQDTSKYIYICNGTETGDYYFVYNSANYQFTMPTIQSGDILVFDSTTLKLYLDNTEITTTIASTGTLVTLTNTPNPNYECPVKAVGDDGVVNTEIVNKNWLGSGTQLNGYRDTTTNKFEVNFGGVGYYFSTAILPDTITFSCTGGNRANVSYYNEIPAEGVASQSASNSNNLPRTITVDKNYKYMHIQLGYNASPTNIQIETGSTATPYTPHQKQVYNIPCQKPMRAIGDTRDIFFKNTINSEYYNDELELNAWYERHLFKEKILNGTEDYQLGSASTDDNYVFQVIWNQGIDIDENFVDTLCDKLISIGATYGEYKGYESLGFNITSKRLFRIWIKAERLTEKSETAFKNFLSENNITFYYKSLEPTYLQCTPEQVEVLEAIANSTSYYEQTNIFSTDETSPIFDVTAIADMNLVIDELSQALVANGGV